MTIPLHWPVLGICGFSGSGKTTLIEALVPRLSARGLAVAVVKHDAHGMIFDTPGKDTDRFFRSGATVYAHDPGQWFLRRPVGGDLETSLRHLLRDHDVVLVEGHKQTPLPAKVWLSRTPGDAPASNGPFQLDLDLEADRLTAVSGFLDDWLLAQMWHRPLRAGLLIGGGSQRMGQAKQLMEYQGRSWAEHVADALLAHTPDLCLLGEGVVPDALTGLPRLPDAPNTGGPQAGLQSALRWDPEAAWLIAACDMPLLTPAALEWVLDQRVPGTWAVLPRRPGTDRAEPLAAWYDPRLGPVLERCRRPRDAADHPKVVVATVPEAHAAAWRSFNTLEDAGELG